MAVTKWVKEEPNTYQYLSVKISDEKGNDITANINGKVLYSGVEYALYFNETLKAWNIQNVTWTESKKVDFTISYKGYISKTISVKTYMNPYQEGSEKEFETYVTLYPKTLQGQIQRLSEAKRKFVDTFPTILKMEDSIEDYPEILKSHIKQ